MLIVAFLLLPACEEVPPNIDFTELDTTSMNMGGGSDIEKIANDTTFIAAIAEKQNKIVVLEEFSGVRCVNCPDAHVASQLILDNNPGRVATAVIHAGFLADPYPESLESYVLPEGSSLYEMFNTQAVPAAAIDRILFDSESNITILNKNKWAGNVGLRLQETPPVNVYLHHDYNENNRLLQIYVQLRYTENVSAPNFITVYLTESHIIDVQLVPDELSAREQADYEHNHLMRRMLTSVTGNAVSTTTQAGRVWVKRFEATVADHWVAENCEIIAFVHENGANRTILQGAHAHVVE